MSTDDIALERARKGQMAKDNAQKDNKSNISQKEQQQNVEAEKARLKNEINVKDREISDLEDRINQFEGMKNKIAQAIKSLNAAKTNITYAKEKLSTSYVSVSANEWIASCENEGEQMNGLISDLNSILLEVEKEVHSINIEIVDKEDQLVLLMRKLNSL